MRTLAVGVCVVGLAVAVAVGGFAVVYRRVPLARRQDANAVGGYVYAVIGIAYSVLLSFVTSAVWQQYSDAGASAQREAGHLIALYQYAESDGVARQAMREQIRSYLTVVINEEWPLLGQGRASARATASADALRVAVRDADPAETPAGSVRYAEAQREYAALVAERRQRLYAAGDDLPVILWIVLGGSAVVTIAFTYLFGMEDGRMHALMVGVLAMMAATMLFTIRTLDNPYATDLRVQPVAFVRALRSFDAPDAASLAPARSDDPDAQPPGVPG